MLTGDDANDLQLTINMGGVKADFYMTGADKTEYTKRHIMLLADPDNSFAGKLGAGALIAAASLVASSFF